MKCPQCWEQTEVIDSRWRKTTNTIARRRQCPACGHRFTTRELEYTEPQLKAQSRGSAKLTPQQVADIRVRYQSGHDTQRALAHEFRVSKDHINRICNGRYW